MKKTLLYKITRPIIKIFFNILYHPTYIGIDHIPKKGPIILAGNHTNYLDCLLLMSSTNRVIHFLAKDELTKGIKGIIFNHMGIIPVNRKTHDKKALKQAIDILWNKEAIGIFPEGTINRTNDIIMPFKIGAVKMGKESNSPLIPFVITGKYRVFRKKIQIKFFPPYKIENDLDTENEKLMKKIGLELEKENKK